MGWAAWIPPRSAAERPRGLRRNSLAHSPARSLFSDYHRGMKPVRTGLEFLAADPAIVGDRSWALLANHAAVSVDLVNAWTLLAAALPGRLMRVLAPEHGFDGIAQDMESVADSHDPPTGIPVCSLYGAEASSLEPRADHLEDVRVVVVDLPDIGSRYYTFAATMDATMAACERRGIEVVVLDRPNPVGGVMREGGLVQRGYESFVSRLPVPARHGLTLGEVALLLQRERYPDLELSVVACDGWCRSQWWSETGLPWVPPSPNMPTLETAALYPGLCLVEATTLSEGRGTTRPFHLVGAPWIDAQALVDRLRSTRTTGAAFRAARFRPAFGKHAGAVCSGVEVHVVDRCAMRPVELGLRLLQTIHDLDPARFEWRPEPYEFVSEVPAIDLLTGSSAARQRIEDGESLEPLLARWRDDVEEFEGELDDILLYHRP
jgi:uncharacterized protein YbbC (DUF1343 family)